LHPKESSSHGARGETPARKKSKQIKTGWSGAPQNGTKKRKRAQKKRGNKWRNQPWKKKSRQKAAKDSGGRGRGFRDASKEASWEPGLCVEEKTTRCTERELPRKKKKVTEKNLGPRSTYGKRGTLHYTRVLSALIHNGEHTEKGGGEKTERGGKLRGSQGLKRRRETQNCQKASSCLQKSKKIKRKRKN